MKKLHSLLTFALLFVCAHVASAKLVLGEHKTTFSDGDKVIIEGCSNTASPDWVPAFYLYGLEKENRSVQLTRHTGLPITGSTFIHELQDANEPIVYNGKTYTGWYLYCPGINKFVVRDGSYYNYKYNKERAMVFYIVPNSEYRLMRGYEPVGDDDPQKNAKEGSFNIVVRYQSDGEGSGQDGYDYYAVNHGNSDITDNTPYTGCGCWWRFYEGSDVIDAAVELESLLVEVEPIIRNAKEGTTNGCIADLPSFNALKTAYENAKAEGVDMEAVYPVLKEALVTFRSFGNNGFIPLTDGFYRIISGYDPFFEEGGVYKGMSVNLSRNNALFSARFEQENRLYIWKVTSTDAPNRYIIRNVDMMEYINNPTLDKDGFVLTSPTEVTCAVTMSSHCNAKYIIGNNACINYRWVDTGADRDSRLNSQSASSINPDSDPALWRFEKVEDISWDELEGSMQQIVRNGEYAELLHTAMNTYRIAVGFLPYDKNENNLITYEPAETEDPTAITYGDAGTWKGGTVKCNFKSPTHGSYGALCDGLIEDNSFFHSHWISGSTDWHYLQFDLTEPIENVAFYWSRRIPEGEPRRISKFDVQVCNDTTGGGSWTTVATMDADYVISGDEIEIDGKTVVGNDEVFTGVAPLFGSYKHIRMVVKEVMSRSFDKATGLPQYRLNAATSSGFPYFTAAELHILGVDVDPDCQMSALKNNAAIRPLIEALEKELAHATTVTEPTADDMANLQKAYDDFVAVFPDPTPLKALIEDTQTYMKNMYVGNVSGTYASQEELDNQLIKVLEAIEDAQADIDAMTLYTIQQVDDHIAAINAARQALIDGARPIDFTKWIRLYLTREYWVRNPENKPADWPDNVAMYAPEEAESEITQVPFGLFDPNMSTAFDWRFVPVKDGYFIQSRSTGKFIGSGRVYESSRDWDPGLSSVPAVFTVEPIGGGSFVIVGKNMDGSEVTYYDNQRYLHGAFAAEKVTYWFDRHLGSNSGWEFEVQAAGAFDDAAREEMMNNATVTKHLVPNRLYTACYPTDVTLASDNDDMIVTVYKVVGKNVDESVVYLEKMEGEDGLISIPAGTVFLYEMGEEGTNFTDYVYAEDKEDTAQMLVYYDFYPTTDAEENESLYARAPQRTEGLVGVYADQKIYKGHGLVSVYEGSNAVLPYGIFFVEEDDETIETVLHRTEAYIDTKSAAVLSDSEAADFLALPIAGQIDNAVDKIISGDDNATTVDIYTIEGVRVRANVTKADALKGLKSGLYIVNKTKVLVK